MNKRKPYPSDLSDERWVPIDPAITAWKQERLRRSATGAPGSWDPREIVNVIFYPEPGRDVRGNTCPMISPPGQQCSATSPCRPRIQPGTGSGGRTTAHSASLMSEGSRPTRSK